MYGGVILWTSGAVIINKTRHNNDNKYMQSIYVSGVEYVAEREYRKELNKCYQQVFQNNQILKRNGIKIHSFNKGRKRRVKKTDVISSQHGNLILADQARDAVKNAREHVYKVRAMAKKIQNTKPVPRVQRGGGNHLKAQREIDARAMWQFRRDVATECAFLSIAVVAVSQIIALTITYFIK